MNAVRSTARQGNLMNRVPLSRPAGSLLRHQRVEAVEQIEGFAGGEQRQIVGEAGESVALFALFQDFQNLFGARCDRSRQAGQLGDMDAVGAVGGAGANLVQKDDLALPFLDPHRVAGERRQFRGQRRQLVIMGRE